MDKIINEGTSEFKHAVAIVEYNGKFLLGLSTAKDCRKDSWCLTGGHIEGAESPQCAAVRECREESGVVCVPCGPVVMDSNHSKVAFVPCKVKKKSDSFLKLSPEFSALGWFSEEEFKSIKLMSNVRSLVKSYKRICDRS